MFLSLSVIPALFIVNNANAAYFTSLSDYNEDQLNLDIENGLFVEEFTASSFIGDDGIVDYELELKHKENILDTEQFFWNNEEVDFELSFDGTNLTYKVDETIVQSIDVAYGDFDINGMILSATAKNKKSSVSISNLMVNGYVSTEDLFAKKGNIDFLKIDGLDNSFTLTGTQKFSWKGERPNNFDLAYKIRVGSFQDPVVKATNDEVEVPEPSSIAFLSLGAISLLVKRRQQAI